MVHETKRSKRSKAVGFTALGMVGMLSGCGSAEAPVAPDATQMAVAAKPVETQSTYVYRSVAQCVRDGNFSKAKCEEGYAAAVKERNETGKSHATKQECEEEYGEGNCESRRGGRFAGVMLGYFIGRSSDGSKYSYSGLYNDKKSGSLVTGSNSWMNNGQAQKYSIASNDFKQKTSLAEPSQREKSRAAVIARGGFGGGGSAAAGGKSIAMASGGGKGG
jgi:uncharacterized protein YgiB involved in biofilm formation